MVAAAQNSTGYGAMARLDSSAARIEWPGLTYDAARLQLHDEASVFVRHTSPAKKASSRELAFVLSLPRWMRRSVNLLELADRDLSIDLCRPNVGVTEHLLDETNVRTVLMHQRRQRVPE